MPTLLYSTTTPSKNTTRRAYTYRHEPSDAHEMDTPRAHKSRNLIRRWNTQYTKVTNEQTHKHLVSADIPAREQELHAEAKPANRTKTAPARSICRGQACDSCSL